MSLQRAFIPLCTILLAPALSMPAKSGAQLPAVSTPTKSSGSTVIEKTLTFPSPIQWQLNRDNRNVEISLTGLAWGPAFAPEIIAKASEQHLNEKADHFSERPYVIALAFEARIAEPLLDMRTRSGLVLIKDSNGNIEPPWDVSPSGLVAKDYDIHFSRGNVRTQYWNFFPVSSDQKQFLFKARSPAQTIQYFRVILKDKELIVVNATPQTPSACLQFEKIFGGSIGADSVVSLQITRQNTILSGTEQRAMLSSNAEIPPEFSRPEVVAILKEYYAGLQSKSAAS